MTKKIWLNEEEYRAIMPITREAGLYETDRKTTYWHKKASGLVLGPRVMK